MSNRFAGSVPVLALVVVVSLASVSTAGQQVPQPGRHISEPGVPWPLPVNNFTPSRTADGTPDLQGNWGPDRTPNHSVEDGVDPLDGVVQQRAQRYRNILVDPKQGRIPYQPWAQARRDENLRNNHTPTKWSHLDIDDRCLLHGVPRNNWYQGMQILQRPGYVVFLHNYNHAYRVIPTNGRPHLSENITLWMGDSRGRWEGNTLVVEVTNNNDKPWFDSHGSFRGDATRMVERWTLVDTETMYYQVTIDDPKVFTQPWTMALTFLRDDDEEQWETACYEGHKTALMLDVGRQEKAAGRTGIHEHPLEPSMKEGQWYKR